jgi:chromosomal replication initiator protein
MICHSIPHLTDKPFNAPGVNMRSTWDEIKNQLRSKLPENTFSLWISPITFLGNNDKSLILGCPNKFSRAWVMANFLELIQEALDKAGANAQDLVFKVAPPKTKKTSSYLPPDPQQLLLPNMPRNGRGGHFCLNNDFTFARFIVGRSNEFAYSASNTLAHGDPCHYQSLLMLGNTGLGKTHLSHSVGHAILEHNPQTRVHYITAEDFANDMIFSLKNNRIEEFKNRYRRGCDVLLLEEIHFLSGKEKTQVELGYTLDALANDNKKVIFTSSLPPKDIPRMSSELSSRLTSSLVTTIGKPDYETRVEILTKKSQEHALVLSEKVLHFLAEHLKRDIRQMESALKCLKAKSELLKAKIDIELAKEVVTCLVTARSSTTIEDIKKLVSRYYKVESDILQSKSRKKAHAYPRNIYAYLCRQHTDETLENIARTINRSHSTVLYASELVQKKMKVDPAIRRQVDFLTKKLEDMKT